MNKHFTLQRKIFFGLLLAGGIFPLRLMAASNENLVATGISQQLRTVKGKVLDISQEPVIGASVVVVGTTQGVITDLDGNFELQVPENAVLEISYIGYKTKKMKITSTNQNLKVVLQEASELLDEVVVVGYGIQKKVNLTGAVASVRPSDIQNIPVSNTSSLLQGRLSGVTVSSFSSQPGKDDDIEIRVRGVGTFGNSNPLILIDGIEGSLSSVAPNDIENISVLKDASSSAIYGVRAANGVVLVTTKRGAAGKRQLSYNGTFGIQEASVLPEYIDSYRWAVLFNEENNALGGDAPARNYTTEMLEKLQTGSDPEHFANTNWMKEVFRLAPIQNHYISMSGGGTDSNYMASIGYISQDGIMEGTSTKKVNFRLNADTKFLNIVTLGMNTSGIYQTITEPLKSTEEIFSKIVDTTRPTIPVKYNNGHWGQYDGNSQFPDPTDNPLEMTTYRGNENVWKFDGKFFLDIEPIKNLHIKSSFAYSYHYSNGSSYEPVYNHYKQDGSYISTGISALNENHVLRQQWINENTISYNLNIADAHEFAFLIGESTQYNGNKYEEAIGENFLTDNLHVLDAARTTSVAGRKEEATLRSLFGRVNYAYENRYLFEFNLRRDESSRIPSKNRDGYFPSFSVGWNVAEEKFMQRQDFFNLLKLRASWGKLGNQDIGYYPYAATYELGANNYIWGTDKVLGAALSSAANPDIKWETTTTTNIGLDMSLFKSKINVTFDWFDKLTSDILLQLPISALVGVNEAPYVNAAKVRNRGWELNLGYNDSWNDFTFSANFNLSRIKNKIEDVNGRENWIEDWTINLEGNPIGAYYGYVADGLYQSQDEIDEVPVSFGSPRVGDIRYKDINGPEGKPDGEITDLDRTVIGNPFPEITYGLNLNSGYKNFDLSIFLQGVGKVDRVMMDYPSIGGGVTERMWDRYHEVENPDGTFPALGNVTYNSLPSSYWIQNASYLRLKNIELGYTLPKKVLNKMHLSNLRVFVSAQNLFTITGVDNYDPERYSTISRNASYPNARTYTIGLNVSL